MKGKEMVRETLIVLRRQLRMNIRNPVMVIAGMMQPVLYLVLFAPLLQPLMGEIGGSNYLTLFVPGLLVQLTLFGAAFSGYGIIGEWREGVIESERVTPASRTALLVGRVMRDELQLLVQVIILIGLGYAMGMDAQPAQVLIGVVITLLLGIACASASSALGLSSKNERSMGSVVNTILMPVVLLSGILLPMQLGPRWLQMLSNFMPTKYIVDGVRSCFAGDLSATSVLWGGAWAVLLAVLGTWWGTASFRRDD